MMEKGNFAKVKMKPINKNATLLTCKARDAENTELSACNSLPNMVDSDALDQPLMFWAL